MSESKVVIVRIHRGVVDHVECPHGVKVIVRDFDVDLLDPDGDRRRSPGETLWEAPESAEDEPDPRFLRRLRDLLAPQ